MGISCFPTELVKGAVGGRSRLSWGVIGWGMGGTACQEWGRHACVRGYLIYLSNNFSFYILFLIDQQED